MGYQVQKQEKANDNSMWKGHLDYHVNSLQEKMEQKVPEGVKYAWLGRG